MFYTSSFARWRKIFRMPKISKLPIIAGMIRLINQTVMDVIQIPRLLTLKSPSSLILTSPRRPMSAMAKLGITASTRNDTLTAQ